MGKSASLGSWLLHTHATTVTMIPIMTCVNEHMQAVFSTINAIDARSESHVFKVLHQQFAAGSHGLMFAHRSISIWLHDTTKRTFVELLVQNGWNSSGSGSGSGSGGGHPHDSQCSVLCSMDMNGVDVALPAFCFTSLGGAPLSNASCSGMHTWHLTVGAVGPCCRCCSVATFSCNSGHSSLTANCTKNRPICLQWILKAGKVGGGSANNAAYTSSGSGLCHMVNTPLSSFLTSSANTCITMMTDVTPVPNSVLDHRSHFQCGFHHAYNQILMDPQNCSLRDRMLQVTPHLYPSRTPLHVTPCVWLSCSLHWLDLSSLPDPLALQTLITRPTSSN